MTDNTDLLQDIPLVASLNFKHLLYFWQMVKTGSVVGAAAALGVSTATVSDQVRQLENALGKTLRRRKGRGLEPTELGLAVYQYAEAIFSAGEALMCFLQGDAVGVDEAAPTTADALPDTGMSLRDKAAEALMQGSYEAAPWAAHGEDYFEELFGWLIQPEEERPSIRSVCPNNLFLQLFTHAVSEDADGRFSRWYQSSAEELKEFGAVCLDLAAELELAVFGTIGGEEPEEPAVLLPTQNTAEAVVRTPADREASPETWNTWPSIRE